MRFALRLCCSEQYVVLHKSVYFCLFGYAADVLVMTEGRDRAHFAPLCCQNMGINVLFVHCFSLFIHIHIHLFIYPVVYLSRFGLELI
jgi:hypothetical protein